MQSKSTPPSYPEIKQKQPNRLFFIRLALTGVLILLIAWPVGRYLWREHRWRWIIIHHTGSDSGDLAAIRKEHQNKGWSDAAYHCIVNNGSRGTVAGQIETTNRWHNRENAGSTKRSYVNSFGIAVVMVGNLHKHAPSLQQREALINLLSRLANEYNIPPERIRGHNELQNTKCPGKYLSIKKIRAELTQKLK